MFTQLLISTTVIELYFKHVNSKMHAVQHVQQMEMMAMIDKHGGGMVRPGSLYKTIFPLLTSQEKCVQ